MAAIPPWSPLQQQSTTGTSTGSALGNVTYTKYPTYTTTTTGTNYWPTVYVQTPQEAFENSDIVRLRKEFWIGRAPGPFRIIGWSWQPFDGQWHFFLETIDGQEVQHLYPSTQYLIRDDFLTAVDKAKRGG